MRILDLNNFYAPTGGGVRTYHERKLDFFAARPEDRYTLVLPGTRERVEARGAAQIVEVPARAMGGAGYRAITSGRRVAALIAELRPELIEIGSPYLLPWLVRRALARAGLRCATVGFVHADVPDTYVRPALAARRLLRPLAGPATALAARQMARTYRWMSATFGASEHVLGKLRALGLRRLFHAPLGVEAELFAPARRDLELRRAHGIADDERLVLFVGRLSGEKGIEHLLAAWPELAGRRDRAGARLRLVVAGHGPREADVAALAAADPSIVRLDHLAGRAEVAGWMASADRFLALGAFETFSLTTLEALACATPVIAPDRGGAAELVRRLGAGATFDPDAPGALAKAILDAASPTTAQTAHLRRTIEAEYTWTAACARLRRAYARVVEAEAAGERARLEAPDGWWPAQRSASPADPPGKIGDSV
ncbi:MAG: glycosyltransferase [Nannocystaceae bacterium]